MKTFIIVSKKSHFSKREAENFGHIQGHEDKKLQYHIERAA